MVFYLLRCVGKTSCLWMSRSCKLYVSIFYPCLHPPIVLEYFCFPVLGFWTEKQWVYMDRPTPPPHYCMEMCLQIAESVCQHYFFFLYIANVHWEAINYTIISKMVIFLKLKEKMIYMFLILCKYWSHSLTWLNIQGIAVNLQIEALGSSITEIFQDAVNCFRDIIWHCSGKFHFTVDNHTSIPEVKYF